MTECCYFNGKIMPKSEAKVSAIDIGILRGYSMFDAMQAYGHHISFLEDHLQRLVNSAKMMQLKLPLSKQKIAEILRTLVKKNGYKYSKIKVVLTGGELVGGLEYDFKKPTFYMLVEELHLIPKTVLKSGAKLISTEYQRQFPIIKTNNYINAVALQPKQQAAKAIEILYVSNGSILECATSNFFIIKDGVLITPAEDILMGITRKAVIKIAEKFMPVEQRDLKFSELKTADESFITASYKGIVPIIKVDKIKIGDGKPGAITKKLIQLLERAAHGF